MSGCDDRMSDDGRMSKWRFADSKMMAAQARARAHACVLQNPEVSVK